MTKFYAAMFSAAILFCAATSPAKALYISYQDSESDSPTAGKYFTGPYVFASVGTRDFNETNFGAGGGVRGQFIDDTLVIGLEGQFADLGADSEFFDEFQTLLDGEGDFSEVVDSLSEEGTDFRVRGIVGFAFLEDKNAMIYGTIAYLNADRTLTEVLEDPEAAVDQFSDTETGLSYGIGFEIGLAKHLGVRVEYTISDDIQPLIPTESSTDLTGRSGIGSEVTFALMVSF